MLRPLKRALASVLAALVVLGAPGLRSYDAAAQVFRASAGAEAGSVRVALPSAAGFGAPAALGAPSLGLLSPSISAFSPAAPSALAGAAPAAAAASAAAPAAAASLSAASPAAAPPASPAAAPALAPAAALAVSPLAAAAASLEVPARTPGASDPSAADFARGTRLFDQAAARPASDDVLPVVAAAQDVEPSPKAGSELAPASAPATPPAGGKTKIPRSMWGLFWGHHIMTVFGIEFHGMEREHEELIFDKLRGMLAPDAMRPPRPLVPKRSLRAA